MHRYGDNGVSYMCRWEQSWLGCGRDMIGLVGSWDRQKWGRANDILVTAELTTTPKSGDVELQTAPRLAAANIAITASGQFGI